MQLGTTVLLVALVLASCGGPMPTARTPEGTLTGEAATFELFIIPWDRCPDLYSAARDFEEAERIVASLDTQAPLAVLTLDDIEAYDPSDGALTLSASSVERVAADTGTPVDLVDAVLGSGCFVLAIGGRRLFGGLTLPIGSAIASGIPTVYPSASGDGLRLLIRPAGPPWFALDRFDADVLSRIHPEELRSYFASVGKLASP